MEEKKNKKSKKKCNCNDCNPDTCDCNCSKEANKLKEEVSYLNEKILRISAEAQNIKRHSEEEKSRLIKYDGEEFIKELLPIIDNFEQAIKLDDNNLNDELSKFLEGFKMIYGNLNKLLKDKEVVEVDALHKPFDENTMHAIMIDKDDEYENNIVLDVMQKGYMYKDKLLRPAMVKVNNKESE